MDVRTCLDKDTYPFIFMFAIATVGFLIAVFLLDIKTEVVTIYFPYAESIMNGTIPDIEYPPFALVFITIPGIFTSSPDIYGVLFVLEAYVFFVIGLVLAKKFAEKFSKDPKLIMMVYTIMMLLMLQFLLDRYDIFPMILTMASLYCFVTKRYLLAWILISVATMTKLYPAVIMPVYLMVMLMDREWIETVKGLFAAAAVAVLTILPFILLGSDVLSYFFGYHMDRPLQVESLAASLIAFAAMLGMTTVHVDFGFGSDNLLGAWPDAVVQYLTPMTVVLLLGLYLFVMFILMRIKKVGMYTEENKMAIMGLTMFAALAIFIVIGKVFSSQYMIWLIPFVLFLPLLSMDETKVKRISIIFLISLVLTQLCFGLNYGVYDGSFEDPGMLLLLVRNLLMLFTIFISFDLLVGYLRCRGPNGIEKGEHRNL